MGRTYAISDVHGMGHLLDRMLEKIAFSEADRLYILGDLIDRGPDPAGVLDLAMERKNIIALKEIMRTHLWIGMIQYRIRFTTGTIIILMIF